MGMRRGFEADFEDLHDICCPSKWKVEGCLPSAKVVEASDRRHVKLGRLPTPTSKFHTSQTIHDAKRNVDRWSTNNEHFDTSLCLITHGKSSA